MVESKGHRIGHCRILFWPQVHTEFAEVRDLSDEGKQEIIVSLSNLVGFPAENRVCSHCLREEAMEAVEVRRVKREHMARRGPAQTGVSGRDGKG